MFSEVSSLSYHLKPIPLHLEMLEVVALSLSLSLLTQQQAAEPQQRIPPTLLSLVTLSPSRAASCPDSAAGAERHARGGHSEHHLTSTDAERSVRLDESDGLQQASLPWSLPSPPTQNPSHSFGRSEPASSLLTRPPPSHRM